MSDQQNNADFKKFSKQLTSRLNSENEARLNELAAKAAEEGIIINTGADMLDYLINLAFAPGAPNESALQPSEGEIVILVNEAEYNAQTAFYKQYQDVDIEAIRNDLQIAIEANSTLSEQIAEKITEAGKFVNGEFFAKDDKELELAWAVLEKRKQAGKVDTSLKSLVAGIFRLIMVPNINAKIDSGEKMDAREYTLHLPESIKKFYK